MPGSHGFSAWVELKTESSGWRKLEEYQPKRSRDDRGVARVSCYIASEAGKNFRVCLALPKNKVKATHHYVDLELDGIGMALSTSAIDRDQQAIEDKTMHYNERLIENDTKVREFMFSELKSSTEEELLRVNAMDVGTIRLQVNSVVRYKQRERPQTRPPPAVDTVHEEKKRNLKHSVGFGKAKPIEVVTSTLIPIGVAELCSFVFNYRDLGTLVADGIAVPQSAPSMSSQWNQSENRGLGELGQGDDSDAEGIGGRSANLPRDDNVVFVAQVVDPCRRSLVKHESEPEVLPNDLEVMRAARSVGALSVDQHQAPREALAVGVPQNSHSCSAPVLPPVKAKHRTATNRTGSAADSPGHLTGFSSHLIDSLDEYGGLEYVTPEPAPLQNEVSTVPSVPQVSTNSPSPAGKGVTQRNTTPKGMGTSEKGPRTSGQAREEDRGVHSTGSVLRSQTLSESGSPNRFSSQRSNLSEPPASIIAPWASPALTPIPKARQPVEVIEISDDDEDLVAVKVDEGGPPPLATNEFNAESIDQSLLAMSIDGATPEPKRSAEGRHSAPTTCRCGATTPSTFSSASLQREIKLSPGRRTNSPGSQCARVLKRKLVPSGTVNISDGEDGTREDPLITALKARIAALQEKDKIMAGRMATQDEIANAQGEIANILAQERGLKPLASRHGRDKKRVKTEVLDD